LERNVVTTRHEKVGETNTRKKGRKLAIMSTLEANRKSSQDRFIFSADMKT
jgi:hypothetical protein